MRCSPSGLRAVSIVVRRGCTGGFTMGRGRFLRLACGLGLVAGATGSVVTVGAAPAGAAPHHDMPPAVQVGYVDSATPDQEYDPEGDTNLPLGTRRDEAGRLHTHRV